MDAIRACSRSRAAWVRNALLGAFAWAVFVGVVRPEWAAALLGLGVAVVVPLGLALRDVGDEAPRRLQLMTLLQLGGTVGLLASYGFYPGMEAALLAAPWALFTGVVLAWHVRLLRATEPDFVLTLFGRRPSLAAWEARPFWPDVDKGPQPGDQRDVYERVVGVEAPGTPEPSGIHARCARAILGYRVFPTSLIVGELRRDPVEVGDTIGLHYPFLPGIVVSFAARVVERFDGADGNVWRTGFTYRTVVGHPEYGDETFSVEKDLTTGQVRVALRSWSRPATLSARLAGPWTRRQQRLAGAAALDNLEKVAAAPGGSAA